MRLSLYARMALILLAGLFAAQLASLWLHWSERSSMVSQTRGQHLADRIAEAVRVLEAESPQQRQSAITALQSNDLRISYIDEAQISPHSPRGQLHAGITARLGSEREIRALGGGGGGGKNPQHANPFRIFDVRLDDGQWIRLQISRESDTPPALPFDFFVHLLISLIIVTGVVMIAVRQATRPLQQLAKAADSWAAIWMRRHWRKKARQKPVRPHKRSIACSKASGGWSMSAPGRSPQSRTTCARR